MAVFRGSILSDVKIVNHTTIWQVVVFSLLATGRLITHYADHQA